MRAPPMWPPAPRIAADGWVDPALLPPSPSPIPSYDSRSERSISTSNESSVTVAQLSKAPKVPLTEETLALHQAWSLDSATSSGSETDEESYRFRSSPPCRIVFEASRRESTPGSAAVEETNNLARQSHTPSLAELGHRWYATCGKELAVYLPSVGADSDARQSAVTAINHQVDDGLKLGVPAGQTGVSNNLHAVSQRTEILTRTRQACEEVAATVAHRGLHVSAKHDKQLNMKRERGGRYRKTQKMNARSCGGGGKSRRRRPRMALKSSYGVI